MGERTQYVPVSRILRWKLLHLHERTERARRAAQESGRTAGGQPPSPSDAPPLGLSLSDSAPGTWFCSLFLFSIFGKLFREVVEARKRKVNHAMTVRALSIYDESITGGE